MLPQPVRVADLLRLAWSRWVVILLFGLGGLAGAIAVYRHSRPSYEAQILIVPLSAGDGSGSLDLLLSGLPLGIEERHSEADRIEAILRSRTVTDGIIDRFDLVRRYQAGNIESARRTLWSSCSVAVDKAQKVVRLRCEDEDPFVARDMANAFGQQADMSLRRLQRTVARDERAFIEARVAQAERHVEASSAELRSFQRKHGIVEPIAQVSAVLAGAASLQRHLIAQRVRVAYTGAFAADDESSMIRLRRQIAAIGAELRSLEHGATSRSIHGPTAAPADPFPPALLVPALRAELEAIVREHRVRIRVAAMLAMRREILALDEARNRSSLVVFDPAVLPTRRVRPTLRILPPGFLGGLLLGVLYISRRSWWRTPARLRR